jgi:hypothetical protein
MWIKRWRVAPALRPSIFGRISNVAVGETSTPHDLLGSKATVAVRQNTLASTWAKRSARRQADDGVWWISPPSLWQVVENRWSKRVGLTAIQRGYGL